MPLVSVQRYAASTAFLEGYGTQYVVGALSFANTTTIVLSNDVFGTPGNYILFDYTGGTFVGGQSELNNNVVVDTTNLLLTGVPTLTNDSLNSRIILNLKSNPTNGKQFVTGDLTFTGSTTMILSSMLYATTGTYELFEVTGTVTGLGFLSCVRPGLTVGTPYQIGNIIYVDLT